MTESTVTIIIAIGVGMMSVIGFFAAYFFKRTMAMMDNMQVTLAGFNTTVRLMQRSLGTSEKTCRATHEKLEERIGKHSCRLDDNDKKIIELDSQLKFMKA